MILSLRSTSFVTLRACLTDADKIRLYTNTLRVDGTMRLSPAHAEMFKRARPAATFERDPEKPQLVLVRRSADEVRL
jgi:hypothetical protein